MGRETGTIRNHPVWKHELMEQKMKNQYIHAAFVTDASGVAIQHLEYMAFGEVFVDERRTGFGTPYKFNAKELDCESGYYYYSARYYDPRMARFLSVDPLAGEMPAWGSFTYTFDNPVRLVDPTGMGPEDPPDAGDDKNKVVYITNSVKEVPNGLLYAGEQLADQLGIEGPKPGLVEGVILGIGITVFGQNKGKGDHSVPEAVGGSNVIVDMEELHMSWAGADVKKHIPNFVYLTDKIGDAAVNMKKAHKNLPDLSFTAHKTKTGTETTVYNLNDSTAIRKTVTTVRPQNDSRGSQASMKLDTFIIE
jgi:RHS repeat-associated protein